MMPEFKEYPGRPLKEKFCIVCHKKINTKDEMYVKQTDFDCEKEGASVYFHVMCWKNRFKVTNLQKKQDLLKNLCGFMKNIEENTGVNIAEIISQKEFIIPPSF